MHPVLIGGTMLWVLLIGGGELDLLDLVSTDGYWKAKGVSVTVEAMLRELEAPEPKAPDVAALIRDLGADDFDTRERAEQRLSAMGGKIHKQVAALLTSKDAEIVERARRILAKLGGARVRQVRRLMPRVTCPLLVIHSTLDTSIHPTSAHRTYERAGSTDKELITLHNSGHCITVDSEWELVAQKTYEFIQMHQ